jgi:carbon storage regulator CsrA
VARSRSVKHQIRGLALTRKAGEQITIYTSDGPIEIQVVRTEKNCVRLKVAAAPSVKIFRSELDVCSPETSPPLEPDYD